MNQANDENNADPQEPPVKNPRADRTDRLANALERVAYKIHDLGNWLMGFLR